MPDDHKRTEPELPEGQADSSSQPTETGVIESQPASPSQPPPKLSARSRARALAARHMSILPNSFTALNLFCGYLSIVFTHQEEYLAAAWLIILANICDILDGRIARLTSVSSKFGAELDSLADLVSFGVAPAFLVFARYLSDMGVTGFIVSSVFVLCGALRLARFNVTPPSTRDVFSGLPIPAGAGILCTMTIFELQFFNFFRFPEVSIPFIVIVTSFLMVSTVEYPAMKKSKKTGFHRRLFVVFYAIALIVTPPLTLFFSTWGFALYGLVLALFKNLLTMVRFLRGSHRHESPNPS